MSPRSFSDSTDLYQMVAHIAYMFPDPAQIAQMGSYVSQIAHMFPRYPIYDPDVSHVSKI